ncbi:MAG TPA: DUF924 family protein [Ramlibacter sp.]|nr:DUF924 family protein [Ramlibacter sp.]
MPAALHSPQEVVAFWRDAGPARWFRKDDAFDREFRERFMGDHEAAARGDSDGWAATPEGALALCILLDQFPRNAFRGTARVFSTDAKARDLARRAVDARFDERVDPELRQFLHLPFSHSEELADQDRAVELASRTSDDSRKWALHHRGIIERFGRFPHRNAALGRKTTPEEQQFLDQGGFSG